MYLFDFLQVELASKLAHNQRYFYHNQLGCV